MSVRIQLTCTYCNHTWTDSLYSDSDLQYKRCQNGTCNDRNLIAKKLVDKFDQYIGCPPFPPKLT